VHSLRNIRQLKEPLALNEDLPPVFIVCVF